MVAGEQWSTTQQANLHTGHHGSLQRRSHLVAGPHLCGHEGHGGGRLYSASGRYMPMGGVKGKGGLPPVMDARA